MGLLSALLNLTGTFIYYYIQAFRYYERLFVIIFSIDCCFAVSFYTYIEMTSEFVSGPATPIQCNTIQQLEKSFVSCSILSSHGSMVLDFSKNSSKSKTLADITKLLTQANDFALRPQRLERVEKAGSSEPCHPYLGP